MSLNTEGTIEIPVFSSFEATEPIGSMRIQRAHVPASPDFVFSLGYMRLSEDAYELRSLALLSDAKYKAYLGQQQGDRIESKLDTLIKALSEEDEQATETLEGKPVPRPKGETRSL